jgi:hypothetical protein
VLEELQPGDPGAIGPYRLVGRLGEGGMGRVFLGMSAGRRPVAVKVIRRDLAADPEFRERFRREVAAARLVNGMFTAMVVDEDVDAPEPWLATAYVAGPSLAEAVRDFGPLPASSVLALAAGLAESLAAIHAANVVHRDLKPSNVLLAEDGPRVIDFGISRAAEATSVTRAGFVVGSPGFMSPEQAEGTAVGPPSDMFSLGAILAFAATGESPFGAGSTAALVYRVVHAPARLNGVPAEIRPLIEQCLAKDPAERPTASAFLTQTAAVQPMTGWLPGAITGAFRVGPGPAPAVPRAAEAVVAAEVASGASRLAEVPLAEVPLAEVPEVPLAELSLAELSGGDARTVTGQAVTPVDGVRQDGRTQAATPTTPVAATDEPTAPVTAAEPVTADEPAASVTVTEPVVPGAADETAVPEPDAVAPVLQAAALDPESPAFVPDPGAATPTLEPETSVLVSEPEVEAPPAVPMPGELLGEHKPSGEEPPGEEPSGEEASDEEPPPRPHRFRVARRPAMITAAAVILAVALATALLESSGPGHAAAADKSHSASAVAATTPGAATTSPVSPSPSPQQSPSAKGTARSTAPSSRSSRSSRTPSAGTGTGSGTDGGNGTTTTPAAPTTQHPTTTAATKAAAKPTHTHKSAPAPTHSQPPPSIGFSVSGASQLSCGSLSGDAPSAGAAASITFNDNSSATVELYKVGDGGALDGEATIGPGAIYTASTAAGEYWMVGYSTGGCLSVFEIDGSGSITIT